MNLLKKYEIPIKKVNFERILHFAINYKWTFNK